MPETLQPTEVLQDTLQLTDLPELAEFLLESKKIKLTLWGWGFSMYPTLRPGDVVEVDPETKALLPGDLVAFQKERKLVCHRLIEIFEKDSALWFRTQGDASSHPDSALPTANILGKVSLIERKGKIWVPPKEVPKPSFEDILFLLLHQFLLHPCTVRAAETLCFLQSFRPFRILYRALLRQKISYVIGIPTTKDLHPKFWRYFPTAKSPSKEMDNEMRYRFLAKKGKDVIGSLEIALSQGKNASVWSVTHLFVKTRVRGCGVASQLLKLSFQMLRSRHSFAVLQIGVDPQNRPALSCLIKRGFLILSQEESVLLQKELPISIHDPHQESELRPYGYHLFSSEAQHFLPPVQMEQYRKSFLTNAVRHLLLEAALFEIDAAFKEKEIDYLVLKGMALAYLLYPDPATRPMGDIDLYLRRKDMPLAFAALKNLGYSMHEEEFERELSAFSGEFAFHKADRPLVELHTSLEQYERLKEMIWIDEEALWKRAISYSISGKTFKALCPEHQLLSLSIHVGLVHRFEGLKWFLDIDRLVMTFGERLNWEELFQTAKRWKVERVVAEVLLTTEELFNTPMPSPPLKKRPSFMHKTAFQWLLLDHPQDQIRVLFRALFPSREWLIYRYRLRKRNRVFWYRFLHPFFVILGVTR